MGAERALQLPLLHIVVIKDPVKVRASQHHGIEPMTFSNHPFSQLLAL